MSWIITPQLRVAGPVITTAKVFTTAAATRAANYTVAYSDNNSNWTDAFSGVMTATTCGLSTGSGTGDGSYGGHRYWRYTVGSSVTGHHPRVSKIMLGTNTSDFVVVQFVADNCSDIGTIPNFLGSQAAYSIDLYAKF